MRIIEVGPRDGLQNESKIISVIDKVELVQKLATAGIKEIEMGSFVSPKWVPQMADTLNVAQRLYALREHNLKLKKAHLSALVPNAVGMESVLKSPIRRIAIFAACSETFSQKNTNCSIKESLIRLTEVMTIAKKNKVLARGYLSTCFGCPYEGKVSPKKVVQLAAKLMSLGVFEVSIGDTIGVATPKQVKILIKLLRKEVGIKKIAMHFHDTRGTALANVYASLEEGVEAFDSSIGSLGGCPYAQGASGNLATEDLVYMLHGMGIKTGVDLNQLIDIKRWVERLVGRDLPSHVGRSGLPRLAVF